MPSENNTPFKSSVKIDNERNLEMQADLANKTAEVVNLVNGEKWTVGGGDSDFSTAEVTFKADSAGYNIGGITNITDNGAVTNNYRVEPAIEPGGLYLTLVLPLYKGVAIIYNDIFYTLAAEFTPVCTGDIVATEDGFRITGNGSITLNGRGIQ